jgi:inner membrane protein
MAQQSYKESIGFRIIIIILLTLVMLVPALMVEQLINERRGRFNEVVYEVSDKWGNPQTLAGPVLSVPYYVTRSDNQGQAYTTTHTAYFLPETLIVAGKMEPEIRQRSIFDVILYRGNWQIKAKFKQPDFATLNVFPSGIYWNKAYLQLGITDLKGISDKINVTVNGETIEPKPGIISRDLATAGISVPLQNLSEESELQVSADLSLNGSRQIEFAPLAEETVIKLQSEWPHPSFFGAFLPREHEITDNGFEAEWRVLHFNRNYPQSWSDNAYNIRPSIFGVELFMPANQYQKTTRTAKYAIMFIGLTFLAYFIIELLNKKRLHPVQYLLVGFAITVFYTLLLSLSEHIGFDFAYLLAALVILGLITAYTWAIMREIKLVVVVASILTMSYVYMYIVLQAEDFALLLGSIGMLSTLAAVMYLTRKIDWYSVIKDKESQ